MAATFIFKKKREDGAAYLKKGRGKKER